MWARFLLLVPLLPSVWGDKFLILHPFYSGSHVLTLHHVSAKLVEKGHKVVTVRFRDFHDFSLKDLGPGHREILLGLDNSDGRLGFVSAEERGKFRVPVEALWQEGLALSTVFKLPKNPWAVVDAYCDRILADAEFVGELKREKFDVAIVDLIYNECGLALATHALGIPATSYWAFSFSGGEAEFTTMATPSSHIPAFMSGLTHDMDFIQRTINTALKFGFARPFMYYHTWVTDSAIRRHFPDCPSSSTLIANLNGAMINTNFVLDYPRLQPITFINVGGMQINEQPGQLPKDIKDFLDSSGTDGTILFTMGFIFQPEVVPASRIQALFDAFEQLPNKVIMKLDPLPEDSGLTVPANVMTKSFLPQQDILAHEKCVLFITHCGMHGVMEAVYRAVPMVGMPVFIDQVDVLARMEEKGIGYGISKWASTKEIVGAVQTVLSDPSYRENVKNLSNLMKIGMAQKPMDNVIWWLEYLSKTKGAEHLKLSSRHLNFLQYHSIDSLAFLISMPVIICLLYLKVVRPILCRRTKPKTD